MALVAIQVGLTEPEGALRDELMRDARASMLGDACNDVPSLVGVAKL